MNNNRKAFTTFEILLAIAIIGILLGMIYSVLRKDSKVKATQETTQAETDSEIHVDLDALKQSNGIEKNVKVLRLYIISMENGKEVSEFFEVLSDLPTSQAEKIATAKAFAVLKGYVTKEEAGKLVFDELDDTTAGVTIVKYYKPTKTSM